MKEIENSVAGKRRHDDPKVLLKTCYGWREKYDCDQGLQELRRRGTPNNRKHNVISGNHGQQRGIKTRSRSNSTKVAKVQTAIASPSPTLFHRSFGQSDIIQQTHEPEIHVQLLMTMEQRQPWIVGHKIDRNFLIPAKHDHIFHHPRGRSSGDVGQFEAMPV